MPFAGALGPRQGGLVTTAAGERRFCIVGGGFTGAAFVIHAVRELRGQLAFDIVEPAPEIGRGIAYATADPLHRINVPSDRMSLFPEDGEHATRWLHAKGFLPGDGSSADQTGAWYVPRWHYGTYVHDVLDEVVAEARGRVRLRHHRSRAEDVGKTRQGWQIRLSSGEVVAADELVLAIGHATPQLPFPVSESARAHAGLIARTWDPAALDAIAPEAEVLIMGTGLTMADMVETLFARHHRGPVTALSRRGLLPQPQGLFRSDDFLQGAPLPRTALGLLQLARRRAAEAEADGRGWQVAADALRFQLGVIWPELPTSQKQLVMARLLPFWDTHRFRIAPQPERTLRRALSRGKVELRRGTITSVDSQGGRLVATIKAGSFVERRPFDAVVLCLGPSRDPRRNPLIGRLFDSGIARPDALGAGLAVTRSSRLVARDGSVHRAALALGPMTRATFGEMTGAPDIVRHIQGLMREMAMLP